MRRTLAILAVAFLSLATAALGTMFMARRAPGPSPAPQPRPDPVEARAGDLRLSAQLDRAWFSERGGSEAYLEVDVMADSRPDEKPRVPVNAVLIIDRSGSMQGEKIERAKDAARELLGKLTGDDRFSLVEFGSEAGVLVPSMAANNGAREQALSLVAQLYAHGGTNMSAALELAAAELRKGQAEGRVDKVFLASDGQANEGISTRPGLLSLAKSAFGPRTTVSTFGVGEDYDEDLMTAFAAQAGGLTHFIRRGDELIPAFRAELSRAGNVIARNVRLEVTPARGVHVTKVIGYESEGGWVRLPDFAAGERRRVLVKLEIGPGKGAVSLASVALKFDGQNASASATAIATGTYTADEALAGKRDSETAFNGARAEMADLANQAASLAAMGDRRQATAKLMQLGQLRAFAARNSAVKGAAKDKAEQEAAAYVKLIDNTIPALAGAPAPAPAKAAKQQAFDVTRETY
jgi:Ca-activated chloride channel family protein